MWFLIYIIVLLDHQNDNKRDSIINLFGGSSDCDWAILVHSGTDPAMFLFKF